MKRGAPVTAPAMPLVTAWPAGPVIVRLGVSEANSPTEGWLVRWDDIVVRQL